MYVNTLLKKYIYLLLSAMVLLILWNLDMLNSHFKTGFLYAFFIFVGHGDCIERQIVRLHSVVVHVAVTIIIKCFAIVEPIIAIKISFISYQFS